jgi:hypothetical protein
MCKDNKRKITNDFRGLSITKFANPCLDNVELEKVAKNYSIIAAGVTLYVCTYTDELLPGGREAPSLEGSLPPLGVSSTTLGLEMSPFSAEDMK